MFSTSILSCEIIHINKNMIYDLKQLEEFYKENIERLQNDIMKYETRHSANLEKFYPQYHDNWMTFKAFRLKEKEILESRLQHLIEDMKETIND